MRCAGGKGKCFQQVINILPPHTVYVEAYLGGGSVLRNKQPATENIGIDRDPAVITVWRRELPLLASYVEGDALDFLSSRNFAGHEVVYCDPPYLPSTRRRSRVYRYDYSERDHVQLLETVCSLPCRVVLSGYPSELYDERLRGWTRRSFLSKAHNGLREEMLWFNFAPPDRLHDARYIGQNFRERETVKRRFERLKRRITDLEPREKHRLLDWLSDELRGDDANGRMLSPKR